MSLKEEIARIVCCLSDNPTECAYCKRHTGCPEQWPDVTEQTDSILSKVAEAVGKVENPCEPTTRYMEGRRDGFEMARQAILKAIKEE